MFDTYVEDQLREIAESLAEVLRPRGYRFAKKGLSFSRRKAGFGFRIEFLLRREFVELLVEVNSTAMKAWRQEEGYIPVSPVVLFGPLNGLLEQDSYRWEVTRPSVAAQEMLSVIEREVEPIFELFSDLPRALEATKANRIPGWLRERRLDFILWCDES